LSSDLDPAELEEIRKRRLQAIQQRTAEEQRQEQVEAAKKVVLRKVLDPKARQRLANIKMVRPDFAQQLELQLIQLAQSGRVTLPISDEQLRQMLYQLQSQRRDRQIRRL
jgi:programmed cell death protein 5